MLRRINDFPFVPTSPALLQLDFDAYEYALVFWIHQPPSSPIEPWDVACF